MSGLRPGAALMVDFEFRVLTRLRAVIWLAAMVCAGGTLSLLPPAHAAESAAPVTEQVMRVADWTAIKKVIVDQRNALKAGDAPKAFSYASPGIRDQFGDAATFIGMVRATYSALLTARYTEFLEGAVIDGAVIQPLRLIDADNTVRVALYIMQRQDNGTWRIGGCRIAPSKVQAT